MTDPTFDLSHLRVGILALGDRSFTHFCGFGRMLSDWFEARGAEILFDLIDVDRGDANTLRRWYLHVANLAGTSEEPDWHAPPVLDVCLQRRVHLNPGSQGSPVYRLELATKSGEPWPEW